MGTAEDMRAMAGALDKVKASLVAGYAAKSGRTAEEVSALMAAETWLDAADALAQGFADRVIEPVRIAAKFDIGCFRNAPPELAEAVEPETDAIDENDHDDTDSDEAITDAEETDAASGSEDDARVGTDPDPAPASTAAGHVAAGNMPPDVPNPAAIRAEAIAHARAVVDLCRLAGQPRMVGRLLEEDSSLEAVRAALLAAKAEAEPEIAPHHPQPGRSTSARPWGEIVARTFKLKG
jgi:hypothetical protein